MGLDVAGVPFGVTLSLLIASPMVTDVPIAVGIGAPRYPHTAGVMPLV